ncbi:MAG: DNA mismatch endonuclease Vsr [Acetobacteraceae bacterium]|nr:DNA mismatch endonuclease Vsr [Acetobacteraceae bacterium]
MDRSANMRAIRSKGMKPELAVRRLAHSLGYRYRLHRPDLPGKPDLVFPSRRRVIFVHGCFWHAHNCRLSHLPKSNAGYWAPKLERNRARDQQHLQALRDAGWEVLVIWECEIGDPGTLAGRLHSFLGEIVGGPL